MIRLSNPSDVAIKIDYIISLSSLFLLKIPLRGQGADRLNISLLVVKFESISRITTTLSEGRNYEAQNSPITSYNRTRLQTQAAIAILSTCFVLLIL
jgi:hypothetical protein